MGSNTVDLVSTYQRRISSLRSAICKMSKPYERLGNRVY